MILVDMEEVGHGTAQEMGQGPPRFIGCGIGVVCGIEFQPGALGILLQQAQPFQTTACTLANQVNQILQLTFIRRPDPLKSGRPVIAIAVYAIQEQGSAMWRDAACWQAKILPIPMMIICRNMGRDRWRRYLRPYLITSDM